MPKGHSHLPIAAPNLGGQYTIYFGTYKLSAFVGCFYLARASYKGVSFNGAAAGWPNLSSYGMVSPNEEGPLTIDLKGISAKGGTGTITLKDPTGKIVDTGTVVIKGSKIIR